MIVVVATAVMLAGGVWLLAGAVWPAPVPLRTALLRLRAEEPSAEQFVRVGAGDTSFVVMTGRWLLRWVRVSAFVDERTASDLALVRRPLEVFAGMSALASVIGGFSGPLLWALFAAAGTSLPVVVPIWLLVAGAIAGWFVPRGSLRAEAATARTDFRHAIGAYLDVLVLLLAAHEGPESAMEIAAAAGRGPAFDELRLAVSEARLSGDPVWDTLDELGRRLRVVELRDVAAAGSLAGESGAAVRKSLTAKARALRATALSEAEATARKRSQAMFAPLVLMGLGFITFLVYPLLTNLTIGGT